MTDSASRDPDQLASDLVDGLLPPDEAARLRADPEVAARVVRIEALRSALRSTPPAPPPAGALDRMVSAAVDAATGSGAGHGAGPRHLHPVPSSPRHSAPPTPRARAARPWLAAAAAVAVGLAMAGLLARGDSSDSDDMATSGDDAGSAQDSAESAPSAAEESADDTGTAPGSDGGDGDLGASETDGAGEAPADDEATVDTPLSAFAGSAESPEELADLVRAQRAASPDAPPVVAGEQAAEPCPGLRPEGDSARGVATYSAEAEYQGMPVTVHVYEDESGRRLVATDQSCTDVVDEPFDG